MKQRSDRNILRFQKVEDILNFPYPRDIKQFFYKLR